MGDQGAEPLTTNPKIKSSQNGPLYGGHCTKRKDMGESSCKDRGAYLLLIYF